LEQPVLVDRVELERVQRGDVLPSGKRVIVGRFSPLGPDIGSVSDEWESPAAGPSAIFTPPRKK
jgi:hypothetical protein